MSILTHDFAMLGELYMGASVFKKTNETLIWQCVHDFEIYVWRKSELLGIAQFSQCHLPRIEL